MFSPPKVTDTLPALVRLMLPEVVARTPVSAPVTPPMVNAPVLFRTMPPVAVCASTLLTCVSISPTWPVAPMPVLADRAKRWAVMFRVPGVVPSLPSVIAPFVEVTLTRPAAPAVNAPRAMPSRADRVMSVPA